MIQHSKMKRQNVHGMAMKFPERLYCATLKHSHATWLYNYTSMHVSTCTSYKSNIL